MGSVAVDQLTFDGQVVQHVDVPLGEKAKNNLLLSALPGARTERVAGVRAIRYGEHVLLKKQVTHLGIPWPGFKKRIQIPKSWLEAEHEIVSQGLTPHFVGIYHHDGVTVFVDFDPSRYVLRSANNSAAHVATNDLFQAQTHGSFSRRDSGGNRLTSVRADQFAAYLDGVLPHSDPHLETFSRFNADFLSGHRIEALTAVKAMHDAHWPDRFQGEWAGFYLEYRFEEFLQRSARRHLVEFQKVKTRGEADYDFDLAFMRGGNVLHYGDLKASSIDSRESPGNDSLSLTQCVKQYGRFWYVIYEHETWKSRDDGDRAVVAWNEWRRSVGFAARKAYDPMSYAGRFKAAVRFVNMSILEVNQANLGLVLGEFHQGRQQGGAPRALKVMINKRNIDNFLVFSDLAPSVDV